MSPNVLAQRLRGLEGIGVARRRRLPPPAASKLYELTRWGSGLEPVIVSLGRWGTRSPSRLQDAGMGVDTPIFSFRTMFDPRAAGDLSAAYELRVGEDSFRDPSTLAALVYGSRRLDEALGLGDARIEDDDFWRTNPRFQGGNLDHSLSRRPVRARLAAAPKQGSGSHLCSGGIR